MPSEITAAPKVAQEAPNPSVHPDRSAEDKAADQAQENQQAQQAAAVADQVKTDITQKLDKSPSLSFEFMTAFSTTVQEGYENYKVPQSDSSSSAWNDTRGQENQRELQVVREFVREATRLLSDQKMEVSQMIHRIKADQGGIFWNKLQQVLQKGISPQQAVAFQKLDKDAGDIKHKFGAPEIPVLGEKAGETGKALKNPAGQVLLEMLKAESNPTTQVEHMILALQILHREGMKDSSQKLLSYLKQRWGLSDDELQRFLSDHNLPYYLGPMPRRDNLEKSQGTFWYPLLALVVVPIGMLAGMDFVWALVLGIALSGFFLIFNAQNKK